jgi:hypothetical protein
MPEEEDKTEDFGEKDRTEADDPAALDRLKAELEALRAALKKSNADAARNRAKAKAAAAPEPRDGQQPPPPPAGPTASDKRAASMAITLELVDAGLSRAEASALARMVDVDIDEFAETGVLPDITGEIDRLKQTFPRLFAAEAEAPRRAGTTGRLAAAPPPAGKAGTLSERQARFLIH